MAIGRLIKDINNKRPEKYNWYFLVFSVYYKFLIHEFIHALCSKTNGGDKNKRYATGMFDELQTEVIAQSLSPYQSENFKLIY